MRHNIIWLQSWTNLFRKHFYVANSFPSDRAALSKWRNVSCPDPNVSEVEIKVNNKILFVYSETTQGICKFEYIVTNKKSHIWAIQTFLRDAQEVFSIFLEKGLWTRHCKNRHAMRAPLNTEEKLTRRGMHGANRWLLVCFPSLFLHKKIKFVNAFFRQT